MTRRNKPAVILVLVLALHAGAAQADRADRDKPIRLEADQVSLDNLKQVGVFTGSVVMTQGTLSITGDQVVVFQGARGLKRGTVTGKPATFRQKREGMPDYVKGEGQRIEYNAVSGTMDIYGKAHVKQGQNEVHGEHIVYDVRRETFQVSGEPTQKGRATFIINNPSAASAVQPTDSLSIRMDPRLNGPEKKK